MKISQLFCKHIYKYEKGEYLGNRFVPSHYLDKWNVYKRMAVTYHCIKCGKFTLKEQIMPMEISENE